jgi:2-polyprenyl-3-methyl-5-hydroxy-6-metoxy-1,4-benzoquinol methylase
MPSTTPFHQPTPTLFFETVQGYQRAYALKAAVDLDLFTAIARGSATVAELARTCKAQERGVRILADYMTVTGFLVKSGERYSLTPDSAFFLDSRSPAYMGKAMTFLLHPAQTEQIRHLAETIRKGEGPSHGLAPDDPIWVDFAKGMAPMMFAAAQAIAGTLKPALAGKAAPKVLDIAAGHGIFGISIAQQCPNAQIYALDWAPVLQVAQQNATAMGVADRYHLLPGSAFAVEAGTGYDAVLLTNFLHHFDAATNVTLLKKVHAALAPGCQAVILEFVPNDDRISPPVAAMFSMTMLSNTPHGDAYTFAELCDMCRNAGLESAQLVSLAPGPESLVIVRRPV